MCDPTRFSAVVFDPGLQAWRIYHPALRGANWFGLGANPLVFWKAYQTQRVEQQLDYAKNAHINSLRVFLSYDAYTLDPPGYLAKFNHLLSACCDRGIVLLVTLMDFCFGWNGPHAEERWSGSPGVFFMERLSLAPFLAYIDAILAAADQHEPWLVMYDLANEPSSNPWSWKDPLGSGVPALTAPVNILVFLNTVLSKLFADASAHEITIGEGMTAAFSSPDFLAQYPFTFQSVHGGYEDPLEISNLMQTISQTSLRPVVLTETAAAPAVIPDAVIAGGQFLCGFMFWGMMKGFNQWNTWTGLFYADGSVTNVAAWEALHGGGPPPHHGTQPIPFMNEKQQIRKALKRMHDVGTVTAENADEMRSLPWELLFWGVFKDQPAVHNNLLGIHQQVMAAYAGGNIPAAHVAIQQFVTVAHASAHLINMHFENAQPESNDAR